MKDRFYLTFEESFRGTRELILERLRVYDDFLIPLQNTHRGSAVVDLGCGRGEWIEKMLAMGFAAHGVDLDAAMLQSGQDKGFDVHQGDALAYLCHLPDNSQAIVSAFHLVEHISFDQLQALMVQAMRVLKPAGLLIMETPNPENLVVATRNFYLDPTHQRPIPPELLTFLPRLAGYERTQLVRLQEASDLRHKAAPTLADVIGGASPDYAVIAQKSGPTADLLALTPAFAKEYGLSLQTLIERYDHTAQTQFKSLQTQLQMLATQLAQTTQLAEQAAARAQWAIASVHTAQAQTFMGRLTSPWRWLKLQSQRVAQQGLASRIKALIKKVLRVAGVWDWAQKITGATGAVKPPVLTPRAQEIRADLKKALAESGDA